MNALTLNLPPILELTDEQFYQLCQVNRDLRIERSAKGELIIMPPTGGETGNRNIEIAFDSSTCFKLPNGAERSPDASWVRREKWNSLSDEQKRKFPPLCPDFVLELHSETDALKPLQAKMQEYMENGTSLGWLIDPKTKQVEIYRTGKEVEVLNNPHQIFGEDILPGFVLNIKPIFSSI